MPIKGRNQPANRRLGPKRHSCSQQLLRSGEISGVWPASACKNEMPTPAMTEEPPIHSSLKHASDVEIHGPTRPSLTISSVSALGGGFKWSPFLQTLRIFSLKEPSASEATRLEAIAIRLEATGTSQKANVFTRPFRPFLFPGRC